MSAAETTESVGAPPPEKAGKTVRGRRLRSLRNVKSGLAAVIRRLEAGEMEPKRANSLIYAYSTLAARIENEQAAVVEQRLLAIEEMLAGAGHA